MVIASNRIKNYYKSINGELEKALRTAIKARRKGLDPEKTVEVSIASNLSERVIGLLGLLYPQIVNTKIPERIHELEKEYGSLDWRVALKIAEEVAKQKFCKFKDEKEAIEAGIRTGFAYITLGVVSSPIEGFLGVDFVERKDGTGKYFRLNYAGPIRSAGGTAASVSVIIADYLRRIFGYKEYDPTEEEIKRAYTELEDYHTRITNLQYFPTREETLFLASKLPVQISGDASTDREVSNYKDLPRIPTNYIRTGYCLVMGECLALKAPKLWKQLSKWGKEFGLEWSFLEKFLEIQKRVRSKKEEVSKGITPDYAYIKDLVSGRPVLAHPSRSGGFRLRLGRTRTSGYSGQAIHPSTFYILDNFIAIATQLKTERPGKATSVTPCDTIEPPIVKLKDGTVMRIDDPLKAKEIRGDIEEILYLGDILVSYGDFFNRAHPLVPLGYCEEWWIQEQLNNIIKMFSSLDIERVGEVTEINTSRLKSIFSLETVPTPEEALLIAISTNTPIHPRYSFYWTSITSRDVFRLVNYLRKGRYYVEEKLGENNTDKIPKNIRELLLIKKIVLPLLSEKRILELLGVPHKVVNNEFVVIEEYSIPLIAALWYLFKEDVSFEDEKDIMELVNESSLVTQRDKGGTFIGARMGRPEKAKLRAMEGSPAGLFPVGKEGGRMRSFNAALEVGKITSNFPVRFCPKCKREVVFNICEYCGSETTPAFFHNKLNFEKGNPYREKTVDPTILLDATLRLFEKNKARLPVPELIKGVRGTMNKDHSCEHLGKAFLRARNNLTVNKDGTIRFDSSEVALTHFRPREIGTPIDKLRELGYEYDIFGNPLVNEDQILELFPQDIILPASTSSPHEPADEVFFRVGNFIDELFQYFYGMDPYYNFTSKKDLVGHLVVVLAPHTSAGVVGRIIGFSKTQGLIAHPLVHAGVRRDVDGDEAALILLMDLFLNFSRHYLPSTRGGTQDAPIVITTILDPKEVDDMYFDIDITDRYPLELYKAAQEFKMPWDIKVKQVSDVLGKECQYDGFLFTHDNKDLNNGVGCSAYKTLPSMEEKLNGQMELAKKIRAVDESDVAKLIIDKHFLKDIKGNLRKFSIQEFRCVKCNTKYRRPPLSGKCEKCGGRIIFTVSEGSITKYLSYAMNLAEEYDVPFFMKESLYLLKERLDQVFGKEKETQSGLSSFI